jgi:hypothetical protein
MPVASARAAFDLQITEIWPGNEPGGNQSEDWFEVTNFGDMAWTAATDGDLYYDDDSVSFTDADLMSGVASIAAGESVIFVDGGPAGAAEFIDLWDDTFALWQVGSFNGSGLGQGGDAVSLFIDDMAPAGPPALTLLDVEGYPDADSNGGQSWDVVLGAFSVRGNANGAAGTAAVNDANQRSFGSPGIPTVPEPASVLLLVAGAAGLANIRRRS